jgi:putative transposase
MPQYRRVRVEGSVFFFTVVLAERPSNLLEDQIDRLRQVYRTIQQRRPFETIAICVLPDHLHALWALPDGDADFSSRWSSIKSGFSRGLDPAQARSTSKVAKREKAFGSVGIGSTLFAMTRILNAIVDYIHFNPVKHGHVTRVADWPHSSFHRYVERGLLAADWGGDVRDIQGSFGE